MKSKRIQEVIEFNSTTSHCESQLPEKLIRKPGDSYVYLGHSTDNSPIGIPEGTDGHVLIVGGSGTGKTTGIVFPTMATWQGPMLALDIKGDLSREYGRLFAEGKVSRPYVVFDPTDPNGPSYDPFDWLERDGEEHLANNIADLALTLVPDQANVPDPFWSRSERGLIEAGLLQFFQQGLSFPETASMMLALSSGKLVKLLHKSPDERVRVQVKELKNLKPETRSCIGQGVYNRMRSFALDTLAAHALRGKREGAKSFDWSALGDYNVFLRIPAERLDTWGDMVVLMMTQLLRELERRDEKFAQGNQSLRQTLVILDEFPRLGRIPVLENAAATLRSKGVTLLLVTQSIAQLDDVYGERKRRIISDDCAFTAILGANDAETQDYLAKRVGTVVRPKLSFSGSIDCKSDDLHESVCAQRELSVQTHELATLGSVLLLSPYGVCEIAKHKPYLINRSAAESDGAAMEYRNPGETMRNEKAIIKTFDERITDANQKLIAYRQAQRDQRKADTKDRKRRQFILGGLLLDYIPQLNDIELGTAEECDERFGAVKQVLAYLMNHPEIIEEALKNGLSSEEDSDA